MKPPIQSENALLFWAFKAILKERKLTYAELARRIGKSESTIKRVFSIEECSLGGLMELLNSVELSFSDLITYAEQKRIDATEFSVVAEEFLAGSLDYFFIYRKLFHHKNVATVRRRENLSAAQMTKYLKKLDELEIIKWLPGDLIHFNHGEYIRFRSDGPLKAAVYKAWAPKLHSLVLANMNQPEHTLRLFSARCTPELRQIFLDDFEELVDRIVKLASLEARTNPTRVRSMGVSLAVGPIRIGLDANDVVSDGKSALDNDRPPP